jgi:hypothetical protein
LVFYREIDGQPDCADIDEAKFENPDVSKPIQKIMILKELLNSFFRVQKKALLLVRKVEQG